MHGIDPTNPQSVQEALTGGLFAPQHTPEQEAALRRLETLLALVEGWVDAVVAAAAGDRMPGADALREASRRRRATGGPAEQTFATLVGLELRPRRLREAAALWWSVTEKHGVSGRDGLWSHPDLLPTRRRPRRPARLRRASSPKHPDDLSGLDEDEPTDPSRASSATHQQPQPQLSRSGENARAGQLRSVRRRSSGEAE